MASGAIIRNPEGKILVLKTTYKEYWEIPGGVVEENESPKQTVEREVLEEIGLEINVSLCLAIHYRSAQGIQDENIMFVFDGGIINDTSELKPDGKEISEARFVSFEEAHNFVGERIASRLPFLQQALQQKRTIYLESIGTLEPSFIS